MTGWLVCMAFELALVSARLVCLGLFIPGCLVCVQVLVLPVQLWVAISCWAVDCLSQARVDPHWCCVLNFRTAACALLLAPAVGFGCLL